MYQRNWSYFLMLMNASRIINKSHVRANQRSMWCSVAGSLSIDKLGSRPQLTLNPEFIYS